MRIIALHSRLASLVGQSGLFVCSQANLVYLIKLIKFNYSFNRVQRGGRVKLVGQLKKEADDLRMFSTPKMP